MSTETSSSPPNRPDVFKNAVIIMLTVISIFAAAVTFLQNYASLRSGDLIQQSEFKAVNSTGLYFSAGLKAAQGNELHQRYADYLQRALRADTKARALRLGGYGDLATDYDIDSIRWTEAAQEIKQEIDADPALAQYGNVVDEYREVLSREAYAEGERQYTLLAQSRAWSAKANGFVAILSTLSVALFLSGLSLTLSSRVKYVLAISGLGLAIICAVWSIGITFSRIPRVSEEAIQHFVDGLVQLNLSELRDEDALTAIEEFNQAIELAPDYGRAYFFRSFANTDSQLTKQHLDTGLAVADMLKALELGDDSSAARGNLGWLYYLNGQYNSALDMTEQGLAISPDECYMAFNRGLILLALGRESQADGAYTDAIGCARNNEDTAYWLDVGVIDLNDLATARPDLVPTLERSIRRLKEAQASLTLFDDVAPRSTSAQIGPLLFGEEVDSDNKIVSPADAFPQSTITVYGQLDFSGMSPGTQWLERWLLDGQETLVIPHDQWEYGESGSEWIGITNDVGLTSGEYQVDIFVEGNLLTSGKFVVDPGPLPRMTSYISDDVHVTINYPEGWNKVDLADNEVSVVAARDPNHPTIFAVTYWQATDGTDDDVFAFFDRHAAALQNNFSNFSGEDAEGFTVAGLEGWLKYYTYTDGQSNPIQGALVGVLDSSRQFVYMLDIETHADEWDAQLDLINVMLRRITINEE